MSALLQAIGKHVASNADKKPSPKAMPKEPRVPSAAPGDDPSEDNQPQDLHTLHANLKDIVPPHVHAELGKAISAHTGKDCP